MKIFLIIIIKRHVALLLSSLAREPLNTMDDEINRSSVATSIKSDDSMWKLCGREVSRSALVFLFQITILYIAIITCFVNLTVRNGPVELWITILSLSLGSILPSPKVKKVGAKNSQPSSLV